MTTLLILAALGQFRYGSAVDSPAPTPPHASVVADPFPARPAPTTWRVRRAVVEVKPKADPPAGAGAGAMPPPGVPERIDLAPILTRLDAIEARLAEVLAKVDAPARLAPARTPAAATAPPPTVHVLADRFGRQWDDSKSGYDGLVRWVEQRNATIAVGLPATPYAAPPYFALPPSSGAFSAGSVCGPGGCAPAGGLFGGRFR